MHTLAQPSPFKKKKKEKKTLPKTHYSIGRISLNHVGSTAALQVERSR